MKLYLLPFEDTLYLVSLPRRPSPLVQSHSDTGNAGIEGYPTQDEPKGKIDDIHNIQTDLMRNASIAMFLLYCSMEPDV